MGIYDQQGGLRISRLYMQDEWVPNLHYHIIGKAVPGELLFREDKDYRRFLRKSLRDSLKHVLEFHVYCLLPNHWHSGVRTRSPAEIEERLAIWKPKRLRAGDRAFLRNELPYKEYLGYCFRNAFMRYAKWYNAKYDRSGQLFLKPTLHGLTTKGRPGVEYSRRMAAYIGLNYAKHHYAAPEDYYHWSSLRRSIYQIVELDIVKYYGSEEAYKAYHIAYMRKYGAHFYSFDEEEFFKGLQPRTYIPDTDKWKEGEWRDSKVGG